MDTIVLPVDIDPKRPLYRMCARHAGPKWSEKMLEFFACLGGLSILIGLIFLIAYFIDQHEKIERMENHMSSVDKNTDRIFSRLYNVEEQIRSMTDEKSGSDN